MTTRNSQNKEKTKVYHFSNIQKIDIIYWIYQQYLPSDIKTKKYYSYCDNKIEQATKLYWEQVMKKAK